MQQAPAKLSCEDSMLSFLPLAHIFGIVMEEGFLSLGFKIGYWRVRLNLSLFKYNYCFLKPFAILSSLPAATVS